MARVEPAPSECGETSVTRKEELPKRKSCNFQRLYNSYKGEFSKNSVSLAVQLIHKISHSTLLVAIERRPNKKGCAMRSPFNSAGLSRPRQTT